MKRFVLIDPSLRSAGGHELENAVHVLQAGREAGYDVALATHRAFPEALGRSLDWPVLGLFRGALARAGQAGSDGDAPRSAVGGIGLRRWRAARHRRRRKEFVASCEELFRDLPPTPGALVYLPMMSATELAALLELLERHRWTREVGWCVQFQYAPAGTGFGQWPYLELARELSGHPVHCFATTEALARSYRDLGLRATGVLPYPADPALRPAPVRSAGGPLDLILAGHLRREKGPHLVREVLDRLWPDYLATGRLRVWFQGSAGRVRSWLPPSLRPVLRTADPGGGAATGPLCRVDHPLSTASYRSLLQNAGIGLLLYDPAAYRDRCSGVLVELLCAGVPVVVPAGSWLSEQLPEPSALRGAVGRSASGAAELAAAVAEIVDGYDRYREAALQHAESWRRRYSPRALLHALERAVSREESGAVDTPDPRPS